MNEVLEFEEPHAGLRDSYRDLVREFRDAGEPLIPFPLTFPNDDFPAFLARLAACARGDGLPPGFVAHSTYWLVSDGAVVGVANLRHALTDALRREGGNIGYGVRPSARGRGFARELLRRTLVRARALGLSEVWLTCAKNNVVSARTILGGGGILLSEEFVPERGGVIQRYRIDLPLG
jgi:predicted acetyltransferase